MSGSVGMLLPWVLLCCCLGHSLLSYIKRERESKREERAVKETKNLLSGLIKSISSVFLFFL